MCSSTSCRSASRPSITSCSSNARKAWSARTRPSSSPPRHRRDPVDEHETLPRGQEFATVGHLYRGIADGLRALSSRLGERALFVGSPRAQATPELLQWPQLVAVTDLESALAAVEEIIEQGEGAQGDWNDAHYGRFLSVRRELDALRQADPTFEPARPVLAAYLRQPFDIPAPRPVVTDPQARRVVELAGLAYELTLHVLLRFFTHTDETDAQLGTLVDAALALMAKVLRPLCTELTTLPVGSSHPGRTAGFAFEMYYVMGNMTPHREPSWALLAERARILAHRCRQLATDRDDGAHPSPAVSGAARTGADRGRLADGPCSRGSPASSRPGDPDVASVRDACRAPPATSTVRRRQIWSAAEVQPSRRIRRTSRTTGSSPTATMSSAGRAAVSKRESLVASHTVMASVSPPSGRSSAVAGSSFITSTSTSRAAVKMPGPQQRQVDVGEHPGAVGAEGAGGVVEVRG